jgi:hypothetical protein
MSIVQFSAVEGSNEIETTFCTPLTQNPSRMHRNGLARNKKNREQIYVFEERVAIQNRLYLAPFSVLA